MSALPSQHELTSSVPDIERRVRRQLDFKILPMICFFMFVSFLDRGNIGNAKIQGMTEQLHMRGNDYNIAVMLFTVAYIIFGLPTSLIFKKTGPQSLSVMMFLWGVCVIGEGLVKTSAQLQALRFLMGMFESGFVPGCAYLISSYYTQDEFLLRYCLFFSMAILAGAFNGLLATVFSLMKGLGGYSGICALMILDGNFADSVEGWRWIFIMEGLLTILASLLSMFFLVPFPEQNTMFLEKEKACVLARKADEEVEDSDEPVWKHTLAACRDLKVWLSILIYFGAEENASGTVAFQPTVLKGLGYSSTSAQVHSIPIYMTAWIIMLLCSMISMRIGKRYPFVLLGCVLNMVGLAIELAQPHEEGVKYLGLFFLTTGSYIVMPITVVLLSINVKKGYQRAAALGLLAPIGNCGAILSSNVFVTKEAPVYRTGFGTGLGVNCVSLIGIVTLVLHLSMENRKSAGKRFYI